MNNPSPFSPQQPILDQKNKNRQRVFVIGSAVVVGNVVLLMTLLMFGCRKPTEGENSAQTAEPTNTIAAFEAPTNNFVAEVPTNTPPTNTYVAPLPPEPTNIVPAIALGAQEYKIAKGDTFAVLAKKFGVSVKAIEDANPGIDPKRLKIDQTIHIPSATVSPTGTVGGNAPTTMSETSSGGAQQTHKVKSGDTLTSIAKHYGVTVKAIRSANNLTSDRITVGQVLKIPAKPATAAPATNPGTGA